MKPIHTEGLPLDFRPYHPEPLSRDADPHTSMQAAASMRSASHAQKLAILEHLAKCGEYGATANELDVAMAWRDGTSGRRLKELRALDRVVVKQDVERTNSAVLPRIIRSYPVTRPTTSGRMAEVHCLRGAL